MRTSIIGDRSVETRSIAAYLAISFGVSWTTAGVLAAVGADLGAIGTTLLLSTGYMWGPAVAALVLQWRSDEPIRAGLGLRRGRLRWVLLAWLAPVAFFGAAVAIGALLPGVSITTDYASILQDMGMTPEQVSASVAQFEAFPVPPVVFLVVQGLVAGLTINALAALGEELGWRSYLLQRLAPLGYWRTSLVTGIVWGVWHAPLVLQGHNFPETPLLGVAVMTLWTVAASPVFTYLTVRARTVLAPAVFHGSFNAVASLVLLHLTGAPNVVLAPVGLVGVATAALATGLCVLHDRRFADEAITDGAPLAPW